MPGAALLLCSNSSNTWRQAKCHSTTAWTLNCLPYSIQLLPSLVHTVQDINTSSQGLSSWIVAGCACVQVLPQQYGGTAELLHITDAVRRFKLPPYPHLPELRAAKAVAAAAGLSTSAASVASEAPSDDEVEESEYHDALEEFAAEMESQAAAAAAGTAAAGHSSQAESKVQQQRQGVVAVSAVTAASRQ